MIITPAPVTVKIDSLTAWAQKASEEDRIWVFVGDTPEAISEVKSTDDENRAYRATLRNMASPVDEKAGRVWITVQEVMPDESMATKIVIMDE